MSDMGHLGGHGGHLHIGSGGDGFGVSHSFDMPQAHNGQGFLSHLFGSDQGVHGHQGQGLHHGVPIDHNPQGSISWTSALRAMKPSDAFQGLQIGCNQMFLIGFVLFTGWLGVVYWLRHHEPLANQIFGTGGGYSTTAAADRRIVAGMRQAIPIRTGSAIGAVYVPNSGLDSQPLPQASDSSVSSSAYAACLPGQPATDASAKVLAAAPAPPAASSVPNPSFGSPSVTVQQHPAPSQSALPTSSAQAVSAVPLALPGRGNTAATVRLRTGTYLLPVQTPEGLRIKICTSR